MLQRISLTILWMVAAFALPISASAAVRINEIAWMGTLNSGTDEWIELMNDSDAPVDLSGWKIEAEDGSPVISLSGVIAAQGYFLIERTDDSSVPEVSADLVAAFGSGLGNTGETLRLRDTAGSVVDTVVGGTDWSLIGGDNATKDTPQRLQKSNTWIVATPTPRGATVSSGAVLGASTTGSDQTQTQPQTTASASTTPVTRSSYAASVYPRESMTVSAGRDLRSFVGAPVAFHGHALGLYDESIPNATYRWNFGDGSVGEGKDVTHVFRFPGTYTATLRVAYATLVSTDRLVVTVTPVAVVISRVGDGVDGFVELKNNSDHEVDLSWWKLMSQSGVFVLPEFTTISPRETVIFPNITTGFTNTQDGITLSLQDGTPVMNWKGAADAVVSTQPQVVKKTTLAQATAPGAISASRTTAVSRTPSIEPSERPAQWEAESVVASSSAGATVLWSREGKTPLPIFGHSLSDGLRWFFVFFGILVLGVAGVLLLRSRIDQPSPADEYAIISDIIDEGDEEIDLSRK